MQQVVRKQLVRDLALAGFACGAALSFVSGLILGQEPFSYCPQRPFDARAWNDPAWRESDCVETNFHSVRQQMEGDLRSRRLTPGLTRAEVLELLGPGDDEFASSSEAWWSYHLGRSSVWWLHEERLYVSFGPDGRVRGASIGVED